MLELQQIALQLGEEEESAPLLTGVTAHLPTRGHFAAVLGPSGCGKSTLLKLVAGLLEPTEGEIWWEGRNLAEQADLAPGEIGYVPQFSVAHESLTVRETLSTAASLRLRDQSRAEREALRERIGTEVGLEPFWDRRVGVLSGGQRRRLALALELVSAPKLLLCDEVTSGLDPKAEDEIAHLLKRLAHEPEPRLVISVTHSLRHLSLCDSVIVLHQGRLAYHGPPEHLFHYFGVERHEDLFPRLGKRAAAEWHESWQKHRPAYYEQEGWQSLRPSHPAEEKPQLNPFPDELPPLPAELTGQAPPPPTAPREPAPAEEPKPSAPAPTVPGLAAQWGVLLCRRVRLFLRDRGQMGLQAALLFGFPCLVAIFALDGLPQLQSMAASTGGNLLEQVKDEFQRQAEQGRVGSLVSGLIMFQVILLALMGSNNAAREIAAERAILEQEKFAGLNPLAYVLSKATFLGALVVAQAWWMTYFVDWVVRFPGGWGERFWLLAAVNGALTAVCLGISALLRTPEQASLLSVYLVGLQLPLSGAVLALPAMFSALVRPFIASYWGWSGFIHTLRETRFYDAILAVTQTKLASVPLCLWVLGCHVLLGLYLAYAGVRRARWP